MNSIKPTRTKVLFDKEYFEDWLFNFKYCLKTGFIYATIFTLLFNKPRIYYAMALGWSLGYCFQDMTKICIVVKDDVEKYDDFYIDELNELINEHTDINIHDPYSNRLDFSKEIDRNMKNVVKNDENKNDKL